MAKTRNQLQKESDARNNKKIKAFHLDKDFILEFERIAKQQGLANNALLMAALVAYKEKHGIK